MDSVTQGVNLTRDIFAKLVDRPEELVIHGSIDEKGVFIQVKPDKADLGRVIGKQGETVNAVRYILRALGAKNGAFYHLKVVDNG